MSAEAAEVRVGMRVFTLDDQEVGSVVAVLPSVSAASAEPDSVGGNPDPSRAGTRLSVERVGLDVTGAAAPLDVRHPTQAELGVDTGPRDGAENLELTDVGTDYKELGIAGDPRATEEPGLPRSDERDADGYFELATGLRGRSMFVPLSAVVAVSEDRVTVGRSREELDATGWERDPRSGGAVVGDE